MGVGKENVGIENITFLQHDLLAKGSDAGTRINDDAARTTSDLKTGSIAAIFNGIWARTSDASSGSPELEPKSSVIGHKILRVFKNVVFFLLVGNTQCDSLHKKHMSKCVLEFKVIPEASTTEFADLKTEVIRVRVSAPPEKGKANKELIRFIAKRLGIPKTTVVLLSGKTSRRKRIQVNGIGKEQVMRTLHGKE